MKELAVFAAVVTVAFAQVLFPETADSSSGSSSDNSDVVDSQSDNAILDRHFQLLQQGTDEPQQETSGPQQLPNRSQQVTSGPQQVSNQRGSNGNQCRLQDDSQGDCVGFRQCSAFNNLDLKDPNTVSFLRKSVCRLEQGRVDICCPPGNKPVEIPTPCPFPSPLFPSESECGQPKQSNQFDSDRILGGTELQPGSYPWLVALGKANRNSAVFDVNCGGSLITIRHVLSAAHCFSGSVKPTQARVGDHDVTRDDDFANPQTYDIRNFILAGYDDDTNQNDVALLTLDSDVTFNSFVQPICLPFRLDLRNAMFVGDHLDIVGWGRTAFRRRHTSPVPLEAKVEVVTLEKCKRAYAKLQGPIFISDRQVCAGIGGQDTCNGDSGGPLHYKENDTYFLAGVTSFGVACGRPDFPGVYARVGSYLEWINNNVN